MAMRRHLCHCEEAAAAESDEPAAAPAPDPPPVQSDKLTYFLRRPALWAERTILLIGLGDVKTGPLVQLLGAEGDKKVKKHMTEYEKEREADRRRQAAWLPVHDKRFHFQLMSMHVVGADYLPDKVLAHEDKMAVLAEAAKRASEGLHAIALVVPETVDASQVDAYIHYAESITGQGSLEQHGVIVQMTTSDKPAPPPADIPEKLRAKVSGRVIPFRAIPAGSVNMDGWVFRTCRSVPGWVASVVAFVAPLPLVQYLSSRHSLLCQLGRIWRANSYHAVDNEVLAKAREVMAIVNEEVEYQRQVARKIIESYRQTANQKTRDATHNINHVDPSAVYDTQKIEHRRNIKKWIEEIEDAIADPDVSLSPRLIALERELRGLIKTRMPSYLVDHPDYRPPEIDTRTVRQAGELTYSDLDRVVKWMAKAPIPVPGEVMHRDVFTGALMPKEDGSFPDRYKKLTREEILEANRRVNPNSRHIPAHVEALGMGDRA